MNNRFPTITIEDQAGPTRFLPNHARAIDDKESDPQTRRNEPTFRFV
jgi:hypothetical protein